MEESDGGRGETCGMGEARGRERVKESRVRGRRWGWCILFDRQREWGKLMEKSDSR